MVLLPALGRSPELFQDRCSPQCFATVFDPSGDEAEVRGLKQAGTAASDAAVVSNEEVFEGLPAFDLVGF